MMLGSRIQQRRQVLAVVLGFMATLATMPADAQQAIDQQNPSPAWTCLNPGFFTMSQGFTPSFDRMNFAEIHLDGGSSTQLTDGDFSLRVLRNGTVIGESDHVALDASPSTPGGYYRFNFPDEAFLVTGQPHELQLVNHSNSSYFSWCASQNDSYPGGAPILNPSAGEVGDLLFRTGMQSIFGPPQGVTHGNGYMVFESVLPPQTPVTTGGGIDVSASFHSGVNFEISESTRLARIGAYFSGGGPIFGAVFQTNGLTGVPNPHDLSGADVVATTVIDPPAAGGDAWGDVDVTLAPGTYGILFGTNKFGAPTGSNGLRDLNRESNGFWLPYSVRQSDGQRFFQAGDYRIFAEATSAPGTAQARPVFDTQAEQFAGQWILTDGDSSITGARFDFFGDDERALLEFDLNEVPDGATVTSVELRLNPTQITSGGGSGPRLFFHGYAGDGAPAAADAAVPLNEIGATPLITDFDPIVVALDPAYIESLVEQGATHLGLMVRGDNNGHRAFFSTWEDGEPHRVPLLSIQYALPGDYDHDGTVGPADYQLWRSTFGASAAGLAADGDGNGVIDAGDYVIWRANANHGSSTSAPGSAVVPEPTGVALLLMAIVQLLTIARSGARRTSHES